MGLFDELEQVGLDELAWLDEQLKLNLPEFQVEDVEEEIKYNSQVLNSYVRISDDKLTAWLYLREKENGEYTKMEILALLQEFGVSKGVDNDMIIAMIKKHAYEQELVIARGKEAEPGNEGHYEYYFDTENYKKPRILEDGSVDYSSMSELANVYKNQLIAKYFPADEGKPGYTIDGEKIPVTRTKDLPKLKGKGFYLGEDENEYYAEIDGKISIKNDRIEINQVHQIRGDVDLITGKVEFYGDIEITGSVSSGVIIKAGRNVTISGPVSGAEIYACGDVILKKGFQGGNRGKVIAKGDIYTDFVEYGVLVAGGNIEGNTFLSSFLSAEGFIKANGSKGSIIGGYAHGLQGLECRSVGNDYEVKTILHVGYEKEAYNKYTLLKQKEMESKKLISHCMTQIQDLQKEMQLKAIPSYRMTQINQQMNDLINQKNNYDTLLERMEKERTMIEDMIQVGRNAKIVVYDTTHKGCIIGIEKAQLIIEQDVRNRIFFFQSDTVQMK